MARDKKAFTLIEILIVIAIIALLSAILFPVFSRARESARRASCQSNEKQIVLGLTQYAQDYDERLPCYSVSASRSYHVLIEPYVKSYSIFRCPSAPKTQLASTHQYYPTYGLCGIAGSGGNNMYSNTGTHLASIAEPARTFLMVETRDYRDNAYYNEGWALRYVQFSTVSKPEDYAYYNHTIHFEGNNVAFVDGHVKWIKSGEGSNWIWK
jgi:prepilin-type N-terminal cleavage/methylation domain-containing protein/prepilin-type processing-associated H-X9-DG protein